MDTSAVTLIQSATLSVTPNALSKSLPANDIARLQFGQTNAVSKTKKQQVAKDFESVLITNLLKDVENAIGKWGFDEKGVSTQIKGMFGLFLGRALAADGGFGFWKDIYQFLDGNNQTDSNSALVDMVL
jgi:Rod binding domain-containing protein